VKIFLTAQFYCFKLLPAAKRNSWRQEISSRFQGFNVP